jgi:REP element-mobilizing transposase RayT
MRRHDIRLKRFDYRASGLYLVTLVTERRVRSLAQVSSDGVALSPFGEVAQRHCGLLPTWRPQVRVIENVVMPDHVHLLLHFVEDVPAGLGAVVGCFKAGITREVNALRGTPGQGFWQYNYWERIVRTERELVGLRRYFRENPQRWLMKYGPG